MTNLDDKLRKWSLLDNCSTDNVFCNKDHLEDIHEVDTTLDLKSNGGGLSTKWMGTYPGFGEVWYDPKAITNIVSQDLVEKAGFDVDHNKHKKEYKVTSMPVNPIYAIRIGADIYMLLICAHDMFVQSRFYVSISKLWKIF